MTIEAGDETVAAFTREMRAAMGELARVLAQLAELRLAYWGHIRPLLDKSAPDGIIVDGSGLAGAAPLDGKALADLVAYAEQALALNTEPHRQAYIRAAGLGNTLRG